MNVDKVEDWLGTIPSPLTRKSYRTGIKNFEKFLKAEIDSIMDKDDVELGHILEKYYVWLKESGRTQNSCRSSFNPALQYFKYFGKNPRYRKALGIFRTTTAKNEHKLTIAEVQELAKVSDLREQALLEVFLLGLRISDVSTLEWKPFENDEFLLNTRKENITAHIHVSEEFREILSKYLKTIDPKNKYLFQSVKSEHLTVKHIDYMLHSIVRRAGLPNNIHWHLGRKLVFRTGLELGIPNPNMKLMLGKSVPMSDGTYYAESIDLKPDADKLHQTIRLFPSNGNGKNHVKIEALEQAVLNLEKQVASRDAEIEVLRKNQYAHSEVLDKLVKKMETITGILIDDEGKKKEN